MSPAANGAAAVPKTHAARMASLARDTLADIPALLAYRQELDWARTTAPPELRTRSLNRDLVSSARDARDRTVAMVRRTLTIIRMARNTGFLENAYDAWVARLDASGEERASERWKDLLGNAAFKGVVADMGLAPNAIDELGVELDKQDQIHASVDGLLRIRPEGSQVEFTVRRPSPTAPIDGIGALLGQDDFDQIVQAFTDGERPAFSVSVRPRSGRRAVEELDVLDGAATTSLQLVRVMDRHVRKVEELGLDAYRGGDVITAAIVVGIILSVAAVAVAGHCYAVDDFGENNKILCDLVAPIVFLIGVLLLAIGTKAGNQERLIREYEDGINRLYEKVFPNKPPTTDPPPEGIEI